MGILIYPPTPPPKKKVEVMLVAPLFGTMAYFGVFDQKIWIFWARVVILRSQFSLI